MSVTGIASSILAAMNAYQSSKTSHTSSSKIQSEMSQLGQDLQSDNLKQAQSDFAVLSQNLPNGTMPGNFSIATSSTPATQAFSQLGQDLQSGNLPAAQRDYATIQLDMQQTVAQVGGPHHHHRHAQGAQDSSSIQQTNPFAQAFSQLAQELQSGNLQGSQQAFAALQNDLQQVGGFAANGSSGASGAFAPAITGSLNVLV